MPIEIQTCETSSLPSRAAAGVLISLTVHVIALVSVIAIGTLVWFQSARPLPTEFLTVTYATAEDSAHDLSNRILATQPVFDLQDVSGEMVTTRLEEVVQIAEQRDVAENFDELDRLGAKLESVSSEAAVNEIAGALQTWTGTQARATEPVESAEGDFDFETAQLYDVIRSDEDDEQHPYVAILLDSQGRTFRVAMTEAEGGVAFQTFQRLKRFPLAEKIYRQFTMSLLDSLVQTAQSADKQPVNGQSAVEEQIESATNEQ